MPKINLQFGEMDLEDDETSQDDTVLAFLYNGYRVEDSIHRIPGLTEVVGLDTSPDYFTFTAVTGAALSTETESPNTITILGISAATAISVEAGLQYSKNGAAYTATSGTVVYGNTVRVKLTSSGSYDTLISKTLTVGDRTAVFNVTTVSQITASVVENGNSIQILISGGGGTKYYSVDKGTVDSNGVWDATGQCGVGTATVTDDRGGSTTVQAKMPNGSWVLTDTYTNPNAFNTGTCLGMGDAGYCPSSSSYIYTNSFTRMREVYHSYGDMTKASHGGSGHCVSQWGLTPPHYLYSGAPCYNVYIGVQERTTETWSCS